MGLCVLCIRHDEHSRWLWYTRKVINMTNVHEHNDFTVSIKVQQFRSRCAKSVYYNRTRVVCECHGYKRDREPSRVPVRMLKRVSKKIWKLQSYVRSRLIKNVPKSMKFHDVIKNNATWKKGTVKFPHNPILHYAFSSWTEKTMTKIHFHWENRFVLQ